MKIEPKTLKGFRDFLPKNVKKRQFVLNTLTKVFESYGFKPLETPSLEYEEILTGKYGDDGEKLMYKFEDNGKRKVALRYDQTVPLARVVAQYQNEIKFPFKRYQTQNVWRAENTQKGRYREFLQVDADIVGTSTPIADSEILALAIKCLEKLGFENFKALINDRDSEEALFKSSFNIDDNKISLVFRALDKIMKIGRDGVIKELEQNRFTNQQAIEIMDNVKDTKPSKRMEEIFVNLDKMGIANNLYKFDPYLARGLDYYNGIVFEFDVNGYSGGAVAGGGRYDNLIGIFASKTIPAVGFAFGFDRLMEAMEELNLFPSDLQVTKVLVTIPSLEKASLSLKVAEQLRNAKINTEIYLGDNLDLEKQLKYADNEGIPYVVICNEDKLLLKDMDKRTQEEISIEELIKKIS
jgi:histidyl-tRNA synthetase